MISLGFMFFSPNNQAIQTNRRTRTVDADLLFGGLLDENRGLFWKL